MKNVLLGVVVIVVLSGCGMTLNDFTLTSSGNGFAEWIARQQSYQVKMILSVQDAETVTIKLILFINYDIVYQVYI